VPKKPARTRGKRKSRAKTTAVAEKDKTKSKRRGVHELPMRWVRILAGVVSGAALLRSAGYIYGYFYRVDESVFLGILMAIFSSMVTFVAPQIGLIGIRKRNWWLTGLAGVILTIFTIFTIHVTVGNLDYNRAQKDQVSLVAAEKVLEARDVVATAEQSKKDKAVSHQRDGEDMDQLQEKMRRPGNSNQEYLYYRDQYNAKERKYQNYDSEIAVLNIKIQDAKNVPGFYSTEIKNEAQKAADRGGDLAFAIGLDIVGPIFLAFALFL